MTTATQVDAAGAPGAFSPVTSPPAGRWSEAFRRLRRNPVAIARRASWCWPSCWSRIFAPLLAAP